MIWINRPPRPLYYLSDRMREAEEELQRHYQLTHSQKRLGFNMDIISPVREEIVSYFHKKCAFCEDAVYLSSDWVIENFRPRNGARTEEHFFTEHYGWLAYRWENLYLCCSTCSKMRRDFFPMVDESTRAPMNANWEVVQQEKQILLDPCAEDPLPHLDFLDDGSVVGATRRGELTITIFGLNRKVLIAKRREAIAWFLNIMDGAMNSDMEIQQDFRQLVEELFTDRAPQKFAGALRSAYLRHRPNYGTNEPLVEGLFQEIKIDFEEGLAVEAEVDYMEASDTGIEKTNRINEFLKELSVFSVKSIEISNFRNIEYLYLELPQRKQLEDNESWLMLLGNNGIGKSSILQAVAMTLCGLDKLRKLKIKGPDILRRGTAENGFVRIYSNERDEPYELLFTSNKVMTKVTRAPTFVLAYGATRLLPKGKLKEGEIHKGRVNVDNLFDYSAALTDANRWLGSQTAEQLYKKVFPALLDLLDLDGSHTLRLLEGELRVSDGVDEHKLSEVSDGYRGVISLAVDIMKSLSDDIGNYHATQGLVLIDELGNHLHPQWRLRIVPALRRAFPQLQFIVSTHEALCLRGTALGEVAVLRQVDNKVKVLKGEELPDHTVMKVDQLLTSDFFGLLNTFDKTTQEEYEEYYSLLATDEDQMTEEQRERLLGYAETLGEREMVGSSPQMQALFKIVKEVYFDKLNAEGFRTTEELKSETVEEVKSMIQNKKLGWL